jgi:hypothetical protein
MEPLTKESSLIFMERFNFFNDGLLKKIEITYQQTKKGEIRCCSFFCLTTDLHVTPPDNWVCLNLVIYNVLDYCISDRKHQSAQVLSNGIYFVWNSNQVGIDFSGPTDPVSNQEELNKSTMFVIGISVFWKFGNDSDYIHEL